MVTKIIKGLFLAFIMMFMTMYVYAAATSDEGGIPELETPAHVAGAADGDGIPELIIPAHMAVAPDESGMPVHMTFSSSADEKACWDAYQKFMTTADIGALPMIFTREGSTVLGRKGSPLCYNRLFGLKYPTKEIGKEKTEPANELIRSMRNDFRVKLLEVAEAGNTTAQQYVREAFEKKYMGFQAAEIDREVLKKQISTWPEEAKPEKVIPDDLLPLLSGFTDKVRGLMISALVDNDSNKQDQLIGVFSGDMAFVMQDWQKVWGASMMKNALEVIRRIAVLGNVNAFKFMKAKISMPAVQEIAKDPEVINASKAFALTGPIAEIVKPDGSWEAFLKAKRIITE